MESFSIYVHLTVNGEDGGEVSEEFLRDSLFLRVVHWRIAEGNKKYEWT